MSGSKPAVLFLVLVLLCIPHQAWSVPASPDQTQVTQPDGTVVQVVLKGDEWTNWVETVQGYTIAPDSQGVWRYVIEYDGRTPVLDITPAQENPPRNLSPNLRPEPFQEKSIPQDQSPGVPAPSSEAEPEVIIGDLRQAVTGTFSGPILFILASFTDRSGTYNESSWASFISNNIADFYNKSSYGKVTLTPATESYGTSNNGVIGWVNLGYAHPNTGSNTSLANQTLTKDAIIAANPYINYAAYDTNSDGYVDSNELAVVVIAAGYERSYSANYTPNVWGHKWSIASPPTVDGKIVGDYHGGLGGYAQFGEIHQSISSDGHQATMGIMVHELGHLIFGLPDLYDTDYSSSGAGAWCVMSGGSWGRSTSDTYSGQTPVLPSAWIKYTMDWVDGTATTGTVSMVGAGETTATASNSAYRASTSLSNEYFLLENRRPAGYDRGLERWLTSAFGGLAIWHVDENQASNTNDSHRKVDLEEADNTVMGTGPGSATDLWYSGNAVTFDNTSSPDSKLYSGLDSGVSVNSISAAGVTMTARIGVTTTGPVLLWSQPLSSVNTNTYANQDFETAYDSYDTLTADDFTNSKPWLIDRIDIVGNTWSPGTNLTCASSLNFLIFRDNSGVPAGYPDTGLGSGGGTPVWSLSVAPTDSRVSLSTGTGGFQTNVSLTPTSQVSLKPGTYWLLFYPTMDFGTCGQAGLQLSDTTNGSPAQVINVGGSLGFPNAWTSIQSGSTHGAAQHDLAFSLYGQEHGRSSPVMLLLLDN